MSRPRLAVFLPDLRGGGAERTVLDLAVAFSDVTDVDLVLATSGGALASQVPDAVRLVELGASRVAAAVPALARYLRRARPDAMLSALNHANVVAITARSLSRSPVRLVVAEHSHLSTATTHAARRRDRVLPRVLGLVYRRADGVVAVSSGVADDLAARTGLDRGRIQVIPNPLDVDELRRAATAPTGNEWLDGDEAPVVLGVGRLTEQKDFATLLAAFAAVRREVDARLVILGEGEDRPVLEQRIRDLGLEDVVAMPGFVDNPYPWFRAADVFVLSSRWEGLPTVLLEAMAVGTAVVATNCPSGPDEILAAAGAGALVPVGDVAAIADAVVRALREPPEAAPTSTFDRYRPERVRADYARLLGLALS